MALFNLNITDKWHVSDYYEFCQKFSLPFNPLKTVSDLEAIEEHLEKLDGEWSVNYVDKNDQYSDYFEVFAHNGATLSTRHTYSFKIVNWSTYGDNPPTQAEIESLLPKNEDDLAVLGDGDYWLGNLHWDINIFDRECYVGKEPPIDYPVVATVYRCFINDGGEPATDYSSKVARFDVEVVWEVAK
jgi:hypothetical protein